MLYKKVLDLNLIFDHRDQKKGFTLIELVVVISLVSLMFFIAIPRFQVSFFQDNTNQVSISHQTLFTSDIITAYSTNNTFDSGHLLGGNFWSNYNGTDIDGDGIGEEPYLILTLHLDGEHFDSDNYPLMEPTIIPEFPSFIVIPLFLTATFLTFLFKRKITKKNSMDI